ncbi:hypothetical protein HK099_000312 [Clydaea vesicula]|uniref:Uncharacterized protein n=1 Tax=Clydaea vesicula TaxID=447962 RepID=A0AAD5TV92_9FUNG|nr:hypothetical protein HK099_000312 [Clydaea vesicula]
MFLTFYFFGVFVLCSSLPRNTPSKDLIRSLPLGFLADPTIEKGCFSLYESGTYMFENGEFKEIPDAVNLSQNIFNRTLKHPEWKRAKENGAQFWIPILYDVAVDVIASKKIPGFKIEIGLSPSDALDVETVYNVRRILFKRDKEIHLPAGGALPMPQAIRIGQMRRNHFGPDCEHIVLRDHVLKVAVSLNLARGVIDVTQGASLALTETIVNWIVSGVEVFGNVISAEILVSGVHWGMVHFETEVTSN